MSELLSVLKTNGTYNTGNLENMRLSERRQNKVHECMSH